MPDPFWQGNRLRPEQAPVRCFFPSYANALFFFAAVFAGHSAPDIPVRHVDRHDLVPGLLRGFVSQQAVTTRKPFCSELPWNGMIPRKQKKKKFRKRFFQAFFGTFCVTGGSAGNRGRLCGPQRLREIIASADVLPARPFSLLTGSLRCRSSFRSAIGEKSSSFFRPCAHRGLFSCASACFVKR